MEELSCEAWLREPVRLVLPSGRARFLVRVARCGCTECGTGTRTVSTWVCGQGHAENVAWCGTCFNATCEPVTVDAEITLRFHVVRAAAQDGSPPCWTAARPALEDLERRGLL